MCDYPKSLLRFAGQPDSWQLDRIGESDANVFFVPHRNAWLKCAPSGIKQEAEVLECLQGKARVPQVLYYLEENGLQCLMTSSLQGRSLIDPAILACPEKLIHILAFALHELHAIDILVCPLDQHLPVKLRTWDFTPEERAWLTQNMPDEDLVFTHGDACLPNFFCQDERYTGCIDLGDAGVADRWQDLSLGLWSLQYNLGSKAWGIPFLNAYGIEPDERKIEYYLRLNRMDCFDVI